MLRRDGDDLQPRPLVPAAVAKQGLECADAAQAMPAQPTLAPRRRDRLRRRSEGNGGQGASRARPLARRAESTLRPPTDFIRARNPCVRLRLITEGW